ncbi:MAG TPA: SCO family protein [Gammaproteobacteria bacterium]|nr:SCO family protein [Gammaproteobacteria bacterium]HYW93293.1 SCO family protein [Gammaproteobacteria bacterium]
MTRSGRRWLIGSAFAVCLGLAGVIGWMLGIISTMQSRGQSTLPVVGTAPSYRGLTNQLGNKVSSDQFRGKVRVVTFLFPYCTTYCPLIAAHLVGFENLLRSSGLQNRVQIVAFDVDPADTGPKQMRAFLKEYGWNPSNLHWQYLTGKPATIKHVVRDGYHIDYRKVSLKQEAQETGPEQTPQPTVVNPLAQKVKPDYDISHNDGLIIVDRQGRIRKIYDQADTVSIRQLLHTIKPLLKEHGRR